MKSLLFVLLISHDLWISAGLQKKKRPKTQTPIQTELKPPTSEFTITDILSSNPKLSRTRLQVSKYQHEITPNTHNFKYPIKFLRITQIQKLHKISN